MAIVYDKQITKKINEHIENVIPASERKTDNRLEHLGSEIYNQLENLKLWHKFEICDIKHLIELDLEKSK